MHNSLVNFKRGFQVAPLSGPLALLLVILVASMISNYSDLKLSDLPDVTEAISIVFLFMLLGTPYAYLVASFIGIPLFYLAKKIGFINFWSITLGSAFVAIVPIFILTTWFGFNQATNNQNPADLYIAMLVSGYLVGIVF